MDLRRVSFPGDPSSSTGDRYSWLDHHRNSLMALARTKLSFLSDDANSYLLD